MQMWSDLPRETQEFIYQHEIPMKVANVDVALDIDESITRVAGLAQRDGETLFVKSTKDGRDWELPGGRIEPGESPVETVKREVLEETGYEVIDATPRVALVWTLPAANVVQLVFTVELGDQTRDPEDEIEDIGWFADIPDPISFGTEGVTTYQFLIDDTPVEVEFSEELFETIRGAADSRKKSLAVGASATVLGGAIAAGLARRILSREDD